MPKKSKLRSPHILKTKGLAPVMDPHDKRLTNMRAFYYGIDWSVWWDEWYLGIDESGKFVYRTLLQFVKAKAESVNQKNFLLWYLGARESFDNGEMLQAEQKYPFITGGQVDWVKKRATGGWFTTENVTKVSKEISRRFSVLEKMQHAGDEIGVTFLVRARQLAQDLDKHFRGSLFAEGASLEVNRARANIYLDLHNQILKYYTKAQNAYHRSLGVNLDDMSGLVTLMTAAAQQGISGESGRAIPKEQLALQAFLTMTMQKAERYQLPMPADVEQKIIEVVKAADAPPRNKSKLQ